MTTIAPLTTLEHDGADVFGAEEDNLVLFWFAVIIPIGNIIAFLIISYMLYTLIRSFKANQNKKKSSPKSIQISAYVVLVGYLIYNFFGILTKLLLDETNCPVNSGLMQASYFFTRASIYYFFILRCQTVFAESPFKFSKFSLTCIYVFITVLYGFTVLAFIATAGQNVFEEETRICVLYDPTRTLMRYVIIFANLGDFLLGLVTVGLYVKKLRQFHKMIAQMGELDGDSPVNFYHLAQKSAKNAWVAYFSTLLTIAGAMISFLLFNLWLDTIVTAFCVYCGFKTEFSSKVQYYCCECCHNKWLLCICGCCCCPCCNERYFEDDDETQEISSIPSKKSTTTGHTVETTKSTTTGNTPKALEYEITELTEMQQLKDTKDIV
eukprot:197242_1